MGQTPVDLGVVPGLILDKALDLDNVSATGRGQALS